MNDTVGDLVIAVLTKSHIAEAVWEMIRSSEAGPVVVVGDPRLATALGHRGATVVLAGPRTGGFRRARTVRRVAASPEAMPLAPAKARALVGVGSGDELERYLPGWMRACISGGVVATLSRGSAQELSRRLLLAGLSDLVQRRVGRTVVTAGVVKRFSDPGQ